MNLSVHPGRDARRVHELERGEVRPDRALVVGGAARVEPMLRQEVVGHVGQAQDGRALLGASRAGARARRVTAGASRLEGPA